MQHAETGLSNGAFEAWLCSRAYHSYLIYYPISSKNTATGFET